MGTELFRLSPGFPRPARGDIKPTDMVRSTADFFEGGNGLITQPSTLFDRTFTGRHFNVKSNPVEFNQTLERRFSYLSVLGEIMDPKREDMAAQGIFQNKGCGKAP
jgi:hypothetical protein